MRKYFALYLSLALFLLVSFFSCVPQQKSASTKAKLVTVDSQLIAYNAMLKELDAERKKKQDQNEIDDTASARIQKFIGASKADIDKLVSQNALLIGETVVDRNDWVRLRNALTVSQKSLKSIADKTSFINDLIKRNTVVKLDQDVIFDPGKYTVSDDIASKISSFFEPAAKEIDLFIKKYPDFPLSLVITAKGYADGTSIAPGTKLHSELKQRLKLTPGEPDAKELNKELSRARAEEVIKLFKKFTDGRSSDGTNIKNILYLYEGKGEQFPNPRLSDYITNDPRRRVVLLFWSVFPD